MFGFQWPWLGLLAFLPLLVYLMRERRKKSDLPRADDQQATLMHPSLTHLYEAFSATRGRSGISGRVHWVLMLILWCGLVLALMRPQWLIVETSVRTAGHDLVLALDASRSMGALDFSVEGREVTRMSVIKGVAGTFVDAREGDRIGLVVFGDHAYVLSPLTFDVRAVRGLLDVIEPSIAGDATAIGDAIGLTVKKLRERPEGARVLVLVTDGENTAGMLPPAVAAQLARQEGVRIYTIGVGSKGLVPFFEDGRREMLKMEIDEGLLTEIAETTGGEYFRATDTGALEEIYRRIDELEKTEVDAQRVVVTRPLYSWPLAIALAALALLGLFPDGKRRFLRNRYGHA